MTGLCSNQTTGLYCLSNPRDCLLPLPPQWPWNPCRPPSLQLTLCPQRLTFGNCNASTCWQVNYLHQSQLSLFKCTCWMLRSSQWLVCYIQTECYMIKYLRSLLQSSSCHECDGFLVKLRLHGIKMAEQWVLKSKEILQFTAASEGTSSTGGAQVNPLHRIKGIDIDNGLLR